MDFYLNSNLFFISLKKIIVKYSLLIIVISAIMASHGVEAR